MLINILLSIVILYINIATYINYDKIPRYRLPLRCVDERKLYGELTLIAEMNCDIKKLLIT